MNKARRHELKMLKYKRRLVNLGLLPLSEFMIPKKEAVDTCAVKANLKSYRTTGKPCSCWCCSPPDKKYNRAKDKEMFKKILTY